MMTLKCAYCISTKRMKSEIMNANTIIGGYAVCETHWSYARKSDDFIRAIDLIKARNE